MSYNQRFEPTSSGGFCLPPLAAQARRQADARRSWHQNILRACFSCWD